MTAAVGSAGAAVARQQVGQFIGGTWRHAERPETIAVTAPQHGNVLGSIEVATRADVHAAVEAARKAQGAWAALPLRERTRPLFAFRDLLVQHTKELATCAAEESGKTYSEAEAGLLKGIEVSEFALALQNLDDGAGMDVSHGVSCRMRREALGVVAGVVPFNFPAMVPLWMFPIAVTVGNAFILKPSEKVPFTASRFADLMSTAGYPAGIFSILHGSRSVVEQIIDHADVGAVAFVGSTPVAREVYRRATALGKRALALGGAKNAIIAVPDADVAIAAAGIVGSFTGCAGQRCMAPSLLIAVGPCEELIASVVAKTRQLVLGKDMGALIDDAAKHRISSAIADAERAGATIVVDGRQAALPKGKESGSWLGPTIIDHAKPDMACAREEVFGPVLTILRVANLDEALAVESANRFGNATSVFTRSGSTAAQVAERATSGMIGVNVGIPVPREPFSFGGTKESKFGHGDITGRSAVDFWSNLKKITVKWDMQQKSDWMS